jgi:hypothetical protein
MGWKQITGSNVMVNTESGDPEGFLADYFGSGKALSVDILAGSARQRVAIVPLIVSPHDWDVLDSNTSIRSTKYALQTSCEGLYMKYAAIAGDGAWFVALRADGAAVGLSSAAQAADGAYCVEAFTHPYHEDSLAPLYEKAIQWAIARGAESVYTTCSKADEAKRIALSALPSGIVLPVREIDERSGYVG